MNIYNEAKAAGCRIGHHESDLYIEDSPKAREILKRHKMPAKTFRSEGASWLDVPFMYDPFWNKKARR